VNPNIFREYDIRGVADVDMHAPDLETLGAHSGPTTARMGCQRIVTARDMRLSSESFQAALVDGLRATGCDVVEHRSGADPVLNFASRP